MVCRKWGPCILSILLFVLTCTACGAPPVTNVLDSVTVRDGVPGLTRVEWFSTREETWQKLGLKEADWQEVPVSGSGVYVKGEDGKFQLQKLSNPNAEGIIRFYFGCPTDKNGLAKVSYELSYGKDEQQECEKAFGTMREKLMKMLGTPPGGIPEKPTGSVMWYDGGNDWQVGLSMGKRSEREFGGAGFTIMLNLKGPWPNPDPVPMPNG